MFEHKLFSTNGFYPGLSSPISIATSGTISVEITFFVERNYGGAGSYPVLPRKDKYKIKITVKYNDRVWKYENAISQFIKNIIVKLIKIKLDLHSPTVSVLKMNFEKNTEKTPSIKVYKK